MTKVDVAPAVPPTDSPVEQLPPELRKPNLRRWEASRYLELCHGIPVAPATLAKWATVGGGPPFHKAARVPLYPRTGLDSWAVARLGVLVGSTSELAR